MSFSSFFFFFHHTIPSKLAYIPNKYVWYIAIIGYSTRFNFSVRLWELFFFFTFLFPFHILSPFFHFFFSTLDFYRKLNINTAQLYIYLWLLWKVRYLTLTRIILHMLRRKIPFFFSWPLWRICVSRLTTEKRKKKKEKNYLTTIYDISIINAIKIWMNNSSITQR